MCHLHCTVCIAVCRLPVFRYTESPGRGIVAMEYEYKVVCALLNSAAFGDLE